MPVAMHRSASFSSLSGANFQTLGLGMGLNGLASSGQFIGADFDFSASQLATFGNEKLTLQNLNSRLASYINKVVSLEQANLKLEQQIKEFYQSKSSISRKDLSKYYGIIEDLQKQILAKAVEKQEVVLNLETVDLTAKDFQNKYENERNIRLAAEADSARCRNLLEDIKLEKKTLEIQLSGLHEELQFLKKTHEEDLHMVLSQKSASVDVQVDCGPAVKLDKELEEMREQYEALILKNRKKIEQWFQSKVQTLKTVMDQSHTEITTSQTAYSDLKRTHQSLEIEINGFQKQIQSMQKNVVQVSSRYSEQLFHLQVYIDQLQIEIQKITANIKQQSMDYQQLLDIKMRLELEIEEYRRLLGGELHKHHIQEINISKNQHIDTSTTVTETIVKETQEKKVEEEKHIHQKRVKIIMEELVDGVVVSTSVNEKLEDLTT